MAEESAAEPGSGPFSNAISGGKTIEECQAMIQRNLRTPVVKFMLEHLQKSGCVVGDRFIKAVNCDKQMPGGYVRREGICVGHLSGNCHYKWELLWGFMKIRGHEQDCVRRRVMKSVIANPYCSEAAAEDAIEAIWDICYNDTQPLDRAP